MGSISKLNTNHRTNAKAVPADDDICVVCFKTVDIYSIGECDHPVCYECSTRMRVLCQQNECPICRHVLSKVIFINEKSPYRELEINNRSEYYNRKYKIGFHTFEIQQKFNKLLDHPCPKCNTLPYRAFEGLRNHVRKDHNMFYCDLCVDHLKIFTFERRCYTPKELNLHRSKGDADNRSHRGHPLCEYCKKRYLDRDELFRHLRREHYYCHFCDADGSNQFYNDYGALADHFRRDHYLCEEGKCATEQFIGAFRSEIDYKAHVANFHGKNMNKQQAKQTRTLQLEITLGPRGRPTQNEQNHTNIRTQSCTEVEQDAQQSSLPNSDAQQHQVPNINPNNEQDFPALAGTTNMTNVTVPRPPPQPILQIHRTSGLARTKENFPALGSGSHNATAFNGESSLPTPSCSSNKNPPISSIVRNAPPSKTGAIPRTMTPTKTISANSSGLTLHVSNRPTTTKNSNASGGNKKANGSDYPALPTVVKAKNTSIIATVPTTKSTSRTAATVLATALAPAPAPKPTIITSKKTKVSKSVLSDGMIECETSLPLDAISPKHRTMVDDYVSVARPAEFQKIQTIQKTEGTSKLFAQTSLKSPPKLTNLDFPTLGGSAAFALQPTANSVWTKVKWNDKKKEENDVRKNSKVATAPILPKPSNSTPKNTKLNNNNHLSINTKDQDASSTIKEKKSVDKKPKECNGNITKKNANNQAEHSKTAIQTNVSLNSIAISPNNLTFTNSLGKSFSILPTYNYIPPPDALHRNQKLVTYLKDTLTSQEALLEFKHISQNFREGFYRTQPYYEHCQAALKHKFHEVFPELLVLLPDISKQQELYLVHQQHVNKMKPDERLALPKFHVCSKCKQVLVDCDTEAHYKMHDFQKDFPQLQRATGKFSSLT